MKIHMYYQMPASEVIFMKGHEYCSIPAELVDITWRSYMYLILLHTQAVQRFIFAIRNCFKGHYDQDTWLWDILFKMVTYIKGGGGGGYITYVHKHMNLSGMENVCGIMRWWLYVPVSLNMAHTRKQHTIIYACYILEKCSCFIGV